jgi:hypothetical protein
MAALIWFAVAGKDGQPANLLVDGDAKAVTEEILTRSDPPPLVRLQRGDEPVWVNPAQVLYIDGGGDDEGYVASLE